MRKPEAESSDVGRSNFETYSVRFPVLACGDSVLLGRAHRDRTQASSLSSL